jgi:hypothetical protein
LFRNQKAVERRLFITGLHSIIVTMFIVTIIYRRNSYRPYSYRPYSYRRNSYRRNKIYYTEKLAPQPHVVVALGFLTKKRDPSRPDV